MDDKKIVIDAGHGGDDPGASGNGIIEKNLNLDISNYMYDRFKSLGIPVKMIRTTDETISPDERVSRVIDAYGNSDDVIVISNHINAGGGEGAEVIYALRNTSTLPNLILDELEKSGQVTRKAYQRRLPSDTSKDYYFMQRNTGNTQSITVEYGFLDNTNDATKLKNNWQSYADAVVDGILDYINYPSGVGNTYTVKSGDSLWSIAKSYNITVEELKIANNLTSNLLRVGQTLQIPSKDIEPPISDDYKIYTVKSGDSLYSIAKQYGLTVNDLVNYNNLSTTSLKVNQQLLIPIVESDPLYETYTVKSGDSLYSVARANNTTVGELMTLNNLSTSVLNIGQVLRIPKVEVEIEDETPQVQYIVKSGDSLYSIANRYNTTVSNLKDTNNLTSNTLSIGQILIIPSTLSKTYVVKSGDNLYAIARENNTTVDSIKSKNNLTSNLLNVGQVLVL